MRHYLVALALSAAACGTAVKTIEINPAPRAMGPRPPQTVEMFTSGPPQRPYVDVALLEAEEESSFSSDKTPEMLTALRERAAQMGCDAVVLGGMTSRDPNLGDAETWLSDDVRGRKGVYATCIVYTSADATVAGQ
jgi:hypothetical protein